MLQLFKIFVLLAVSLVCVSAWSSNVCSRLICTPKRIRVCSYRTWRGCCAYKYTWVTQYRRERFCCKGWTDTNGNQNCDQPICNPRCENRGKCTAPNICQCKSGYKGPTCAGLRCSHLKPCYPGVCSSGDQCTCDQGFSGASCLNRADIPEQRTQIWLFRSTLKSIQRTTMMLNYEFVLESSNPDESKDEIIWSNHLDLNYFVVESLGQFEPDIKSQPPSYVRSADFGVVESTLTLNHTKIPRTGQPVIPVIEIYKCNASSNDNIPGIWNCTVRQPNFKMKIESGDELRMTIRFESGGSRELIELDLNRFYKNDRFDTLPTTKSIVFKFDKDAPTHCQTDGSNCQINDVPLEVNEITKTGTEIRWGGWRDRQLSGMFRYAVEIFKLEVVDNEGRLGEKEPLNPLQIDEYMHADLGSNLPIRYTPPEPGMYSVILEASDRANNSRWARRLFLFDDQSTIELKSNITVPSAKQLDSGTVWLSTLDSDIEIVWFKHFVNSLHVENNLLNEVKDYPIQFSDIDQKMGFKIKKVTFDSESGTRNKSAVRNIDGIVNFDFVLKSGSNTIIRKTFLQDKYTIQNSDLPVRRDGTSFTVSITAKDILNNTKTDNKTIRFDSSPPVMSELTWEDNLPISNIPRRRPKRQSVDNFASRIIVNASDSNSGIHEIRWHILRQNTSGDSWEGVKSGTVVGTRVQACEKSSCYCISEVDCYDVEHVVNLNMCWFSVARAHINTASVNVTVDAVNPAGLFTSKNIQVMNLESLLKKSYFAPVDNIAVQNVGDDFANIAWNSTKSCLHVSEFWLIRSDRREKEKIHRLSRNYDIAPLDPDTNYTIQFINGYDGEMSDPVVIKFRTGPAPSGISSGSVAGLSVGLIVLILLVLVIVGVLYMRGFIGNRRHTEKLPHDYEAPKRAIFDGNEDIYVYGFAGGNLNLPVGHVIDGSNIVLQELIEQGKFAKIYKATLLGTDGDKTVVAAKMLLDNFTDDERHLMSGKITFMSDVITGHDNVLKFIGAVTDHEIWGPTMIVEYCESGTLLSWLHKNKNNVNDDVIERLYQISFGVVKGMAYLASLNVIHRRLAARNILLTFVLEPKITGFGPSVIDVEKGEKERVAIRWASPECFSSTKNATEKSDVWSIGIVLYEIFSLGDKPYPTLSNNEVIPKVRSGFQMSRPEFSDQFNYDLMLKCWQLDQIQRPSFEYLRDQYHVFMNGEEQTGDYSNYKY